MHLTPRTIFWRYVWDSKEYPEFENVHGYDVINGTLLPGLYGDDYTHPDILNHWWYRVNASTVDVWFEEECRHDLYYFAKDNVCQRSDPIYHETFYVDNSNPYVNITYPKHGYYYNETDEKAYLKTNVTITLTATDLPDNECQAGIETIFWRYVNKTGEYPVEGEQGAINGTVLGTQYGYTDPDILNHWWYFYICSNRVDIKFKNQCQHDLYYWAKDNVCHNSTIYQKTFYVDDTIPDVIINVSGHGYFNDTKADDILEICMGFKRVPRV
jgi:hypothetical protein